VHRQRFKGTSEMDNLNKIIKSAITGVLALTAVSTLVTATSAVAAQKMEKCYGIAKAGMNDCNAHACCAASAKKNNQSDTFLFVPQGMCNKIVGGRLTAKADGK
jgi:uncharacterized membrane protein